MPITLVRQSWPMQINLDLWNVPYMYMWWWNYWKWPMCHNNNWHTLWFGSTFFDKRHTVSACHLTIFKCQPRQAGFPTVLEWPLCALWYVFCFVSSFFSTSEYALRLFLICQLIGQVMAIFADYQLFHLPSPIFFFSWKIFVRHLVRHSGVLIVSQISTALLHTCTQTVSAILFVFIKIGEFWAQGLDFRKKKCIYACILVNSADSYN